jgi:hypothetical protein
MTANRMCRSSRGRVLDRPSDVAVVADPYRPHHVLHDHPRPLMDLLAAVAAHPGVPADRFGAEQYDVAVGYGWVYEHWGRVGLTGVGAWHVGVERRGGLLPGWVLSRTQTVNRFGRQAVFRASPDSRPGYRHSFRGTWRWEEHLLSADAHRRCCR